MNHEVLHYARVKPRRKRRLNRGVCSAIALVLQAGWLLAILVLDKRGARRASLGIAPGGIAAAVFTLWPTPVALVLACASLKSKGVWRNVLGVTVLIVSTAILIVVSRLWGT